MPRARMPWDQLSPTYRKRLEKAGLTKTSFEAGASIKKGRGHEKTPERPIGYNPKKYPQYSQTRGNLEKQLQQKKEQIFGDRPRWDAIKSLKHIRQKPPTMAQLRWALAASPEDLENAVREDYETHSYIGYY